MSPLGNQDIILRHSRVVASFGNEPHNGLSEDWQIPEYIEARQEIDDGRNQHLRSHLAKRRTIKVDNLLMPDREFIIGWQRLGED